MEVTFVLYEFASRVLMFSSQLTHVQRTDHELSRAPKTIRESKEDIAESKEVMLGL